jgi:hypothetical protein
MQTLMLGTSPCKILHCVLCLHNGSEIVLARLVALAAHAAGPRGACISSARKSLPVAWLGLRDGSSFAGQVVVATIAETGEAGAIPLCIHSYWRRYVS